MANYLVFAVPKYLREPLACIHDFSDRFLVPAHMHNRSVIAEQYIRAGPMII